MKHSHRPERFTQRGLTLVEILVSSVLVAGLVGMIALGAMNGFKLDQTQRGNDLNHFNFTRLTEAFYKDVHESAALASKAPDGKRIVLRSADGTTYVTYVIEPQAVKRGESSAADLDPQQWEELTDSKMFGIASGSFAAYQADGTVPASLEQVRRIDLKDLVATLNDNPQSKGLPVLTAFMRSLPVASPTPSAGGLYAILSGGDLELEGTTTIQSISTGEAAIHANGNLTNGGTLTIGGSVEAVGILLNRGNLAGKQFPSAKPVSLPYYTPQQVAALRTEAKTRENDSIKGTLRGYYDDGVKLPGNHVTYVEGLVFIDGTLEIKNNANIAGNGLVICTGPISIDMHPNEDPGSSTLALVSLADEPNAIELTQQGNGNRSGQRHVRGILCAPNGGINLEDTFTLHGAMIAGTTVTSRANLTVDFDPGLSLSILRATY